MNPVETPARAPTFGHAAHRPDHYTDADLAAISRAAHALTRREPISMVGAVVATAGVGTGMAVVAVLCRSLNVGFHEPIAWFALAMPGLLVASIVFAASRADPSSHDQANRILLGAGLCGSCAAPLPVSPRLDRVACTHCNSTWTLASPNPRAQPGAMLLDPSLDGTATRLGTVRPWQRDALGVRVPVAAAFARGILASASSEPLRARRAASFEEMNKAVRHSKKIAALGAMGLLACGAMAVALNGMISGVAGAGAIASVVALLVGGARGSTTARDVRLTMLNDRLCPCCAEDLHANGTMDWNGQPMVRCNRCESRWYIALTGSTFVPRPGRKECPCGYALSGLTPDASAMVTCPECARKCPVPGHAACAVCETALLVDANELYRGTICPTCHTLNRIGAKGIEYE